MENTQTDLIGQVTTIREEAFALVGDLQRSLRADGASTLYTAADEMQAVADRMGRVQALLRSAEAH
jgi:hypothetical protein